MIEVINNLTPEYYESLSGIIEENYQRAFKYKDYVGNVKNQLVEIFKHNNLI
jgi:hypothetical protein